MWHQNSFIQINPQILQGYQPNTGLIINLRSKYQAPGTYMTSFRTPPSSEDLQCHLRSICHAQATVALPFCSRWAYPKPFWNHDRIQHQSSHCQDAPLCRCCDLPIERTHHWRTTTTAPTRSIIYPSWNFYLLLSISSTWCCVVFEGFIQFAGYDFTVYFIVIFSLITLASSESCYPKYLLGDWSSWCLFYECRN